MSKMSKKEQEILEEVHFLEDKYFTYDEPVPFCGTFLYPVSVRNYNEFLSCSKCLTLNKNDDPEGISMSHLDYLLNKMKGETDEAKSWSFLFSRLIEMIFHVENGLKCKGCGALLSYQDYVKRYMDLETQIKSGKIPDKTDILSCDCGGRFEQVIYTKKDEKTGITCLVVDGHVITKDDFQRLRRIVMYQNCPDFQDDSWVDIDIRKDQELKHKLESKEGGKASIERQMVCVSAKSCYTLDEIYKLSMRKFIILLGAIDDAMNYEVARLGLATGMVSSKTPVEHWIYKKEKALYGDMKTLDSFQKEMGH